MTKGYGSGMLKDAEDLAKLCEKVSKNIPYPLSVKLRLHESVNQKFFIFVFIFIFCFILFYFILFYFYFYFYFIFLLKRLKKL